MAQHRCLQALEVSVISSAGADHSVKQQVPLRLPRPGIQNLLDQLLVLTYDGLMLQIGGCQIWPVVFEENRNLVVEYQKFIAAIRTPKTVRRRRKGSQYFLAIQASAVFQVLVNSHRL